MKLLFFHNFDRLVVLTFTPGVLRWTKIFKEMKYGVKILE